MVDMHEAYVCFYVLSFDLFYTDLLMTCIIVHVINILILPNSITHNYLIYISCIHHFLT